MILFKLTQQFEFVSEVILAKPNHHKQAKLIVILLINYLIFKYANEISAWALSYIEMSQPFYTLNFFYHLWTYLSSCLHLVIILFNITLSRITQACFLLSGTFSCLGLLNGYFLMNETNAGCSVWKMVQKSHKV